MAHHQHHRPDCLRHPSRLSLWVGISPLLFTLFIISYFCLCSVPTSFWQDASIWALDPLSISPLTSWSLSIPPFTPNFIPLLYLLLSSFFAGSLHPLAGHFIAEHYIWDGLEQETYSYYGILNIFAYNVSTLLPLSYHVLILSLTGRLPQRTPRLPLHPLDPSSPPQKARTRILRHHPFASFLAGGDMEFY
jgi:hypothetical protein